MSGKKELANIERAEAFWLADGSLGGERLVIVIHGMKPTPCHRVDIDPLTMDPPSFAAVWFQDGDFCIARETPYSYSESFMLPQRVNEVALVCRGADGKPVEKRITVGRFEPNSLRNFHGSARATVIPQGQGLLAGQSAWSVDPVRLSTMLSTSIRTGGLFETSRAVASASRDSGDFTAEIKFWLAGYGRCQIFVERDGRRWVFDGEGGGVPGGGGYSGKIFTNSLDRLVSSTTSCALVAATFYGTIAFFDAGANVLGNFHGGGFGVGGGGYTGHWV